jgi:calcineurin-like phosphoesterase family protein
MSDIFITSDTFFGREQIIKKAKRPFSSVEEMNETLILNWNSVVKEEDIVYHLGNFAWDPFSAEKALRELNGSIIFILGEYDDSLLELYDMFDGIEIIEDQIYKDANIKSVISHWPLEEWSGKKRGIFHYHGATLKNLKTDLRKMNRVNVCTDNWNYTPQKISDLKNMFEEWKSQNKSK